MKWIPIWTRAYGCKDIGQLKRFPIQNHADFFNRKLLLIPEDWPQRYQGWAANVYLGPNLYGPFATVLRADKEEPVITPEDLLSEERSNIPMMKIEPLSIQEYFRSAGQIPEQFLMFLQRLWSALPESKKIEYIQALFKELSKLRAAAQRERDGVQSDTFLDWLNGDMRNYHNGYMGYVFYPMLRCAHNILRSSEKYKKRAKNDKNYGLNTKVKTAPRFFLNPMLSLWERLYGYLFEEGIQHYGGSLRKLEEAISLFLQDEFGSSDYSLERDYEDKWFHIDTKIERSIPSNIIFAISKLLWNEVEVYEWDKIHQAPVLLKPFVSELNRINQGKERIVLVSPQSRDVLPCAAFPKQVEMLQIESIQFWRLFYFVGQSCFDAACRGVRRVDLKNSGGYIQFEYASGGSGCVNITIYGGQKAYAEAFGITLGKSYTEIKNALRLGATCLTPYMQKLKLDGRKTNQPFWLFDFQSKAKSRNRKPFLQIIPSPIFMPYVVKRLAQSEERLLTPILRFPNLPSKGCREHPALLRFHMIMIQNYSHQSKLVLSNKGFLKMNLMDLMRASGIKSPIKTRDKLFGPQGLWSSTWHVQNDIVQLLDEPAQRMILEQGKLRRKSSIRGKRSARKKREKIL
jgi:hypothetical protein